MERTAMSCETNGDSGTTGFAPETVTTEAEVAELTRSRDAGHIMEVLAETDAVAIKFPSTWWGNEAFGIWGEWFFVHPNGTSEKALFVNKGVKMADPVGYLRSARRVNETRGGLNSNAARKFRRKAFNWMDDSAKPGPGMPPTDDRDSFYGGSCPLSVIEVAFRTPPASDNIVYTPGCDVDFTGEGWKAFDAGDATGPMDDGDIRVTGTTRTRYGTKVEMEGDTYGAFKSDGLDDELTFHGDNPFKCAHHTYNGNCWVADADSFIPYVVPVLLDAGYSVAIDRDVAETCRGAYNSAKTAWESN